MGGMVIIKSSVFSKLLMKTAETSVSCAAVIAAGGSSQRMDSVDKLFVEICGIPVLAHTLLAFQNCQNISEIVVVSREEALTRVCELCKKCGADKAIRVMIGGATRLDSVYNGVFAVSDEAQLIAIHDGARPCVDADIINTAVMAAAKYHAAAPAVPVTSTVKRVGGGIILDTLDREDLVEIQTPQVFTAELIKAALTKARNESPAVTDDCMAVELLGFPVRITEGSRRNIKITTSEDIAIAEAIMRVREE